MLAAIAHGLRTLAKGVLGSAALALLVTAACDATDTAPSSTPLIDASGDSSSEDGRVFDDVADAQADGQGMQEESPDAEGPPMFTTILDSFDRPDGPLNSAGVSGWTDGAEQGLLQYAVQGGELSSVGATAAAIWWNAYYGGSATVAEAFVTVRRLSSETTDFSLLIMSQTLTACDFIRIRYDRAAGSLSVSSCQLGSSIVYGAPVEVGDLENRRIGSRFETPSDQLTVYIDATLVGSWKIDQWRYLGRPGRVGLWLERAGSSNERDTFDDFGAR